MTASAAAPDYHEALAALAARGRFGIRLGLGRTRALLAALGDPQHEVRGALVAGTNGKGSVLALAGSALRAAGLRIGETPKPHLVSYRERVTVDGQPISPADFARHVGAVLAVADRVARRHGEPTEFELLTAVVFRHFAESDLDVALVEVGLGGRLDATHAWDGGVAAVTNVALDHTDRLGPTVAAIAREKAAIIERGDLAVTGADGEALPIIRRRARRLGVPLTEVRPAPLLGWDRDGLRVELPRLGAVRVGLRGRHQAANVAVADALLDALDEAGIATADADAASGRVRRRVVAGPARAAHGRWRRDPARRGAQPSGRGSARPGHRRPPPVSRPGPLALVVASMADKDVDGIIEAIARSPALDGATVIATTVDATRAMPADVLAERWRTHLGGRAQVESHPDPLDALAVARRGGGPTVVAGSLYLVGAVRAHLVDDPELRDPPAP